ncbi:synaptonemal complex protein 3 [Brachionichthys hirsutus]|uniref:synaptonemal complex protein 3 n=1 Tax=Brachionichthys hirsutus TaxID=412623 RepID=UPI00360537EB
MANARKQMKRKHAEEKPDRKMLDFSQEDEKKNLSGSEDEARELEMPITEKSTRKRSAAVLEEGAACAVGNEVQTMLERFGADINKVMLAKKKRLEYLTKNYMKGTQQKVDQLWNKYYNQRKGITDQYSQQVNTALEQWETEAQRTEEQEDKLNNLFRQQQKILQQARAAQNQKLKTVRELYEQLIKNMEQMDKTYDGFMQGTQQELKKEMASLQKKILMDTQQKEMASVRQSLQSLLF